MKKFLQLFSLIISIILSFNGIFSEAAAMYQMSTCEEELDYHDYAKIQVSTTDLPGLSLYALNGECYNCSSIFIGNIPFILIM